LYISFSSPPACFLRKWSCSPLLSLLPFLTIIMNFVMSSKWYLKERQLETFPNQKFQLRYEISYQNCQFLSHLRKSSTGSQRQGKKRETTWLQNYFSILFLIWKHGFNGPLITL
jgi:hypothetical protein